MQGTKGFVSWWRDFLAEISTTPNAQCALNMVEGEARELDFDFYSYAVKQGTPFTQPKMEIRGNYPAAWLDRYQSKNYGATDPTIAIGVSASTFVVWSQDVKEKHPMLFREAEEWGLKFGATLTIIGLGNTTRMLSFARKDEDIHDAHIAELELRMNCVLAALTRRLNTLESSGERAPISLSFRETEILKWTADGKSTDEVAIILSISINTVNFHIKNIQKKFGACNKLSAAAQAAAWRLI